MYRLIFGALLLLCAAFGPTAEGIRTRCREGDDDWYFFNGKCYLWSKRTEGWFGAEKHCQALGGHLVSIGSRAENAFLHAMTQCNNQFWIGMVKTDASKKGFTWWDDSPNNYTEAFTKYPNDYHDCVYFYHDSRWFNSICQTLNTYVCMTDAPKTEVGQQQEIQNQPPTDDQPNVDSQPATKQCPADWLALENNCYFVSSEKTNYFNAQMSCESKGATVATVLSAREQQLINIALGCSTEAWIGLEKVRPCVSNPATPFCWIWVDHKPLNYAVWGSGHPSTNKDVECATTNGHWQSRNCYGEYRYVCRKK